MLTYNQLHDKLEASADYTEELHDTEDLYADSCPDGAAVEPEQEYAGTERTYKFTLIYDAAILKQICGHEGNTLHSYFNIEVLDQYANPEKLHHFKCNIGKGMVIYSGMYSVTHGHDHD